MIFQVCIHFITIMQTTHKMHGDVPLWDIVPCSLVNTNWHFRGVFCLHCQADIEWNLKVSVISVSRKKYGNNYDKM